MKDPDGPRTARWWAEALLAILAGNIIYLSLESRLPPALRHQIFRLDWGLALDFLICAAIYGLIRLAGRKWGKQ